LLQGIMPAHQLLLNAASLKVNNDWWATKGKMQLTVKNMQDPTP
jgi:hypothetical protein